MDHFFDLMIFILFFLIASLLYAKVFRRRRDEDGGDKSEKEENWESINGASRSIGILPRVIGNLLGLCGVSQAGVHMSLSRGLQLRVVITNPSVKGHLLARLNLLIRPYCPLSIVEAAANTISICLSPEDVSFYVLIPSLTLILLTRLNF
jgi:hypothetical protein